MPQSPLWMRGQYIECSQFDSDGHNDNVVLFVWGIFGWFNANVCMSVCDTTEHTTATCLNIMWLGAITTTNAKCTCIQLHVARCYVLPVGIIIIWLFVIFFFLQPNILRIFLHCISFFAVSDYSWKKTIYKKAKSTQVKCLTIFNYFQVHLQSMPSILYFFCFPTRRQVNIVCLAISTV